MLEIMLYGVYGRMGRAVCEEVSLQEDMRICCGIDISENKNDLPFPVFDSPFLFSGTADVMIDFSSPSSLPEILKYAVSKKIPVVLATTGYDNIQMEKINDAARSIPVFYSANMSLGINLLSELAKKAAALLGGRFDIEIIEKHHNQKVDAPSGTAKLLADSISETLSFKPQYIYERQSIKQKRSPTEIGIHSIRGGTIIGEHEIIFAGKDEVITLSHSAASRKVFVTGALSAAEFIAYKDKGLYSMSDVVSSMEV